MTKFDILKKLECLIFKSEHSIFIIIRWSIFLNGVQLYIFNKLDYTCMFFRLCTCFSDNLDEFHSINREVLPTT
jgi:hypothetical protein